MWLNIVQKNKNSSNIHYNYFDDPSIQEARLT